MEMLHSELGRLFNYTNKMYTLYLLHIYTTILLHVSAYITSSEINYVFLRLD
jgi:hypothetical protein